MTALLYQCIRVYNLYVLQMVILSLIVKRIRVKALVKDKQAAVEAFGTYVEVGALLLLSYSQHFGGYWGIHFAYCFSKYCWFLMDLVFSFKSIAGSSTDSSSLKKALRGTRAVICTNVCSSNLSSFPFNYLVSSSIVVCHFLDANLWVNMDIIVNNFMCLLFRQWRFSTGRFSIQYWELERSRSYHPIVSGTYFLSCKSGHY